MFLVGFVATTAVAMNEEKNNKKRIYSDMEVQQEINNIHKSFDSIKNNLNEIISDIQNKNKKLKKEEEFENEKERDYYNFFKAVHHGNLEKLQEILNRYTRKNVIDDEIEEHLENFDINAQLCDCKSTALHAALRLKHWDIVQELLTWNARWDIQNSNNNTPLHYAATSENKELLELFKEISEDIKPALNIQDDKGYTPLLIAMSCKNLEFAKFLIECGTDVNIVNQEGFGALRYACVCGDHEMIGLLVSKGASTSTYDIKEQKKVLYRMSKLQELEKDEKWHDCFILNCPFGKTKHSFETRLLGLQHLLSDVNKNKNSFVGLFFAYNHGTKKDQKNSLFLPMLKKAGVIKHIVTKLTEDEYKQGLIHYAFRKNNQNVTF